jgi:hypothetical protein
MLPPHSPADPRLGGSRRGEKPHLYFRRVARQIGRIARTTPRSSRAIWERKTVAMERGGGERAGGCTGQADRGVTSFVPGGVGSGRRDGVGAEVARTARELFAVLPTGAEDDGLWRAAAARRRWEERDGEWGERARAVQRPFDDVWGSDTDAIDKEEKHANPLVKYRNHG